MDVITAVTIVASLVTASAALVAIFRVMRKPDEAWKPPFSALEQRIERHERETYARLGSIDTRLTRVETHVEGISDLKSHLDRLDAKLDSLSNTLIEFMARRDAQQGN